MINESKLANSIKLNRFLGATSRIQTSGVFKSYIDQIAHLEIFLVTCVDNNEKSPNYDKDYPIEGIYFELVNGSESRSFDLASELKSFITNHLETHISKQSASIIKNQQ